MEQHVEKLIEEAAKAAGYGNHGPALQYAQAALNAAQALVQLETAKRLREGGGVTSA